ncbi:MAG: hypothetical protein AMK72_15355 [Planctomycetes bacterium SM23_25]|nr:MAG: hypothetical protein AMK72_15355 [Planctomycetes bacterium SM23_25]
MADDITAHDRRRRRCPMLGHDVPFSYCRMPGRPLPCGRIFDCWWETFDVRTFLGGHFSEADIARILAPPKDKAVTLVELIEKARKANEPKP